MPGLKMIGPFFGASGYADNARQTALAIAETGYPITLEPVEFSKETPTLGEDGEAVRRLCGKDLEYDRVLVVSTPDVWGALTKEDRDRHIIGLTTWETSQLHPVWVSACNRVNEVWVPCRWNREVFTASGVRVPVTVIPHVSRIREATISATEPLQIEGVREDDFVFYSIFHWHERKNPRDLLDAFISAFEGERSVVLVVKTFLERTDEEPTGIHELIEQAKQRCNVMRYPRIVPLVATLAQSEIDALHRRGNCFVLLQRAEGWGLPHFEAAAHGNPVITTDYSGVTDFLTHDTAFLLDYTLRPVTNMAWSPYYSAKGRWASPDLDQAVSALREVAADPERARGRAEQAQRHISRTFSRAAVGKLIVERLEACD